MHHGYLQMVIQKLYELLHRKLCKEKALYLSDGTGYSHRRLDQIIRKYAERRGRWDYYKFKIRGHSKVVIVARYFARRHILAIVSAQPGKSLELHLWCTT
jgi:hypothetical protein